MCMCVCSYVVGNYVTVAPLAPGPRAGVPDLCAEVEQEEEKLAGLCPKEVLPESPLSPQAAPFESGDFR